ALIDVLMSDPDLVGLLMIGAYRDNEVHAGHPLQSLIAALARAQAPCKRIALAALERESVGPLIADTLRISAAEAAPLAALVTAKMQGNPFFVRQFLRTLVRRIRSQRGRQRCRKFAPARRERCSRPSTRSQRQKRAVPFPGSRTPDNRSFRRGLNPRSDSS